MKFIFKVFAFGSLLVCLLVLVGYIYCGVYPFLAKILSLLLSSSNSIELVNLKIQTLHPIIYVIILFVFVLLFVFLLIKQNSIYSLLYSCRRILSESIINVFSIISYKEYLVLIVPFVASIYFAYTIPVSYDEAITYNLFTSKPFYFAAIFYPYPNNHVFHSLLTNFFDILPISNTLFAIRLPAIIANILTWIIALSFFKRYFNSKIAILAIGFCTAFSLTIYYSFMSRGYAMMVLCTVVCFYSAFNILKSNRKRDWVYYALASIVGTYTIPSFLYPLATINVILLLLDFKNIKRLILVNILIVISVILLYTPIILVDGISSLTNNSFVQKINRADILNGIFYFYRGMIAEITGISFSYLWVILLCPVLFVLRNKQQLILWIIILLAPFVLVFIHAVNPFYRTFLYYNFFIVFLFFTSIERYFKKIPIAITFVVIIIQLYAVLHFSFNYSKRSFSTDVDMVVNEFFVSSNTILFPCTTSENYLFEAKVRHLENQITFQVNEYANVDSIKGVKFVIIQKYRDKTIFKKPIYTSEDQNIYLIKN